MKKNKSIVFLLILYLILFTNCETISALLLDLKESEMETPQVNINGKFIVSGWIGEKKYNKEAVIIDNTTAKSYIRYARGQTSKEKFSVDIFSVEFGDTGLYLNISFFNATNEGFKTRLRLLDSNKLPVYVLETDEAKLNYELYKNKSKLVKVTSFIINNEQTFIVADGVDYNDKPKDPSYKENIKIHTGSFLFIEYIEPEAEK